MLILMALNYNIWKQIQKELHIFGLFLALKTNIQYEEWNSVIIIDSADTKREIREWHKQLHIYKCDFIG